MSMALVLTQVAIFHLKFEILENIRTFKNTSSSTHIYAEVVCA